MTGRNRGDRPTYGADVTARVPTAIRTAAALSWRLLLIVLAIGVLAWILGYLAVITVPFAIALLLSALFAPIVARLRTWRVPRALATVIAIVGGLAVVAGIVTLVVSTVSAGLPQLQSQLSASLEALNNWLHTGPLHLRAHELPTALGQIVDSVKKNSTQIATGALSTAAALGEGITAALLTLFTLIFFLYDGTRIWCFVIRVVPTEVRTRVDVAGRRGFAALVAYVRATVAVAAIDAVCIGLGAWLLGVPLAVSLGALVFVGAFIPIIGSVVSGALVVLVALVTKGLLTGLIAVAVVACVMQLEAHVLQPILLGRASRLHPLAVVLALSVGAVVGGVIGALLSVPVLAAVSSSVRSLVHDPPNEEAGEVDALNTENATSDRTE